MAIKEEWIALQELSRPSGLLSRVDRREADADFLLCAAADEGMFYTILSGGEPVGLAQAEPGWLYLYIFPEHRRRGYAAAAAALLEALPHMAEQEELTACWNSGCAAGAALAASCGYREKYASDCMVYAGPPFPPEDPPIRGYRDADYPAAHALTAEAFHRMRLSTGCFPDSALEEGSEEMRRRWADTAGERFVYELEGEILGYAHIEGPELDCVAVKPGRQGGGIGRSLVRHTVNHILSSGHREVFLYCVAGNRRARGLYDSLGFRAVYRNCYGVKKPGGEAGHAARS